MSLKEVIQGLNKENGFQEFKNYTGNEKKEDYYWSKYIFNNLAASKSNPISNSINKLTINDYEKLFEITSNILQTTQPIMINSQKDWIHYFIGDVHGSFSDAYKIINYLIKVMQVNPKTKAVFLGDYVDRNPWDLETLALVTSFYNLFPKNVTLLRGNHEDELISANYGFKDNLIRKFHEKGEKLHNEITKKVFKYLPIALKCELGNKKILAVHGGIPFDQNGLGKLEDTNPRFNNYEEMTQITQTVLWSDPNENIKNLSVDLNSGRQQFGTIAFFEFMKNNQLELLIRAHEKWPEGFKRFFGNCLISLFSTTTYNNNSIGNAAILRVTPDLDKSRIIVFGPNPISDETINLENALLDYGIKKPQTSE